MLQRVIETIPDGNGGFLTMHDVNAITRAIVTILNTTPIRKDGSVADTNILTLFDKNKTSREKFEALIALFRNNEGELYKRFKNSTALNSLANYLNKIQKAIDNTLIYLDSHGQDSNASTIEEEKTLRSEYDIIGQLMSVLTTMQTIAYTRTKKDGIDVNS